MAIIWASVAMTVYGGVRELNETMIGPKWRMQQSWSVTFAISLLGGFGGILALLGVVAAPITTGDTAFRGARLIVADFLNFKQGPVKNRLVISVPLFAVGFLLTQINFAVIWRYFAWANQALGMVFLWTISVYLIQKQKPAWITVIPAMFMTAVISTYIFIAPEGLALDGRIAYPLGIVVTVAVASWFFIYKSELAKRPAKRMKVAPVVEETGFKRKKIAEE
ncbi:MAG: hypothetical protein AB2L20_13785 [Mangrovibacterium sp.]